MKAVSMHMTLVTKYEEMTDEEVIVYAQAGCTLAQDHLLQKYQYFARAKSRIYFLTGGDQDDIMQEGMIGLFKAVRDYRLDRDTSFRSFADLCITRQIITAVKTATRQKHGPLNTYVSLDKPVSDEEADRSLIDVLAAAKVPNPEDIFINQEDYESVSSYMASLMSPLEREVLEMYLEGHSYQEIADRLNKQIKAIDNAIQRIKKKLDKIADEIRAFHK